MVTLEVPPKIKNFIWRCICDAVATKANQIYRVMVMKTHANDVTLVWKILII